MSTPSAPTADFAATAARPAARSRIGIIDTMRGLVMVVMLLDHVRETFYLHKQVGDPMDVATTDPEIFFSRLAAHVCAPMFVFLTGLSAWLYANPASGPRPAGGFLAKRGLLLVALEFTVVSFAWTGDIPLKTVYLQVIWVIGLAMIALAVLHRLPRGVLWAIGLALVFGHNLLTPIGFKPDETGYALWTILHDRGFLVADGPLKIKISYPLLPWIGVIVLGWLAGPLFARSVAAPDRRRTFLLLGLGSLALLAVLRGTNFYGETLPWAAGESALRTAMSFLNYTKYPPSLDFLLFALGLGFTGMALLEPVDNLATRTCATFGGAPMFYYIVHLYLLLVLQKLTVLAVGANHGARFGFDSMVPVWIVWLALVPVLYFPCRAFANFKRTTDIGWVKYF
ncbi:MAG TPA: heparan-alpha-glucosaminide N-acetyltransferase domain-containing protein [Usitatibacteraceae bacterium]|nr:heparan-alpha-glucosaminide N-acetyltransferase domain-containing protein [Usitatibacteraceae bacterium]